MFQPKIVMYDDEKCKLAHLGIRLNIFWILIDSGLNFRNHIEQITVKISKTVGLIAKHFVPRNILFAHLPVLDFFFPYISYGIMV